ncbi:MAG TPA: cytochrome c [Candidatus Aquilonibacter sp.]|nr:cytochrome c [Candidatus Aquilonibacter sp.]
MKGAITIMVLALMAAPVTLAGGGDATLGKDVFMKHCAICHGPNGGGNGPMAKAYKLTPAVLSSKQVQALSDSEIHNIILKGKGKMEPVKGVSAEDIVNVIAYVRTLAKK